MMRLIERVRRVDWAPVALVLLLFSPEIAVFSYIAVAESKSERPEIALGVPGEYLERHGYILGKPGHFTPWVCEHLTKASFVQRSKRDDFTFYADDDVPSEFRATLWDYHGSGYDRGHMAPAGDCEHDAMAMRDCFRLSNMMPQTPELNRVEWRKLEEHVRDLAREDGVQVWVFTGPAFVPDETGEIRFEALGDHQVWIPSHCWKVVFIRDDLPAGEKPISKLHAKLGSSGEVAAWLMPNVANPPKFEDCRVSVDEVEKAAGLDLFSALPDEIEEGLEAAK